VIASKVQENTVFIPPATNSFPTTGRPDSRHCLLAWRWCVQMWYSCITVLNNTTCAVLETKRPTAFASSVCLNKKTLRLCRINSGIFIAKCWQELVYIFIIENIEKSYQHMCSDTIDFHKCWYRVFVNQRFPRFFFSGFESVKCLYNKQNNTWTLGDMNLSSCVQARYLKRSCFSIRFLFICQITILLFWDISPACNRHMSDWLAPR
jgi:predicted small integral membrane protein